MPDQRRQTATHERLAAGDPELLDAELDERRAARVISSNAEDCSRGRNAKSRPKTSLGMQ